MTGASSRACVAAAALLAGVCVHASARADDPAPRIYGGELAEPCEWPTVVWLDGCTGTLVHPRVVVFAAHCGEPERAVFGEDAASPARAIDIDACFANPEYGIAAIGKDQAVCVLEEAVEDVPIVPIAMGCEADEILPGSPATLVGFGRSEDDDAGTKRAVQTEVFSVADGEAFIGGSGKDTCEGDSGGPAFLNVGGGDGPGSWRVFGITSYGEACGQGGYYSMMHTEMAWMQQVADEWDIDLTPCHDVDGTWNPGPDCVGFATDPGTAYDQWQHGCAGPRSGYSAVCGETFEAGDDDTAPDITWLSPEDQGIFDASRGGQISFSADVVDEGWGVGSVELTIDGQLFDTRYAKPYAWQTAVELGLHTATVRATDLAGNEAEQTVEFFVEEPTEEGCACSATKPKRTSSWLLLLAAMAGWRRRSGSSTSRCSRPRPRKSPIRCVRSSGS